MRNISDPNAGSDSDTPRQRIDVIRTAEQPPGYPIAVWTVDKALKSFASLPVADRSLLATQITNAIAAVLLVVPMYCWVAFCSAGMSGSPRQFCSKSYQSRRE